MENSINNLHEQNQKIKALLEKLSSTYDIQSYKNKFMKFIEENNKRIFNSNKIDQKACLLMTRTYYLKEFEKIENIVNNKYFSNQNYNLTNQKYIQLLSYLNVLVNLEDIYINKNDFLRSLQIQTKIVNIIKRYFINKISKD